MFNALDCCVTGLFPRYKFEIRTHFISYHGMVVDNIFGFDEGVIKIYIQYNKHL